MLTIVIIIVILYSIIIHEVSHGLMADRLGDPTPRMNGRLTLNPLSHIDPIGSIIVPLLTYLTAGLAFGWAKPVVYNPYNIKDKKKGEFLIAAAGPASNIFLALIFGLFIRFSPIGTSVAFLEICSYIVLINISLAIFNLMPFPPLDGSKLFLAFLPNQYGALRQNLERMGPILVLILIIFLWQFISPLIPFFFRLLVGY